VAGATFRADSFLSRPATLFMRALGWGVAGIGLWSRLHRENSRVASLHVVGFELSRGIHQ
jgi:hypothetical protein